MIPVFHFGASQRTRRPDARSAYRTHLRTAREPGGVSRCAFRYPALLLWLLTALLPQAHSATSFPTGKGLAQHDLFVGGEDRDVHVIRGGKVEWSWRLTEKRGGVKDAALLSTGDVLIAFQYGALQVSPKKEIVWRYEAPEGFEVHTLGAIGPDRVWLIQNGALAKWMLFNKVSGAEEREFILPTKGSVHTQTRRARLTPDGTLLVAHMDLGELREYDVEGKLVWSVKVEHPWGVARLPNRNTLAFDETHQLAVEFTRGGERVWEYDMNKPFEKRPGTQSITTLPNGNLLLNVRFGPVQLVEVSRDKQIVWALSDPRLGRCACVQVLGSASPVENVNFGPIR